jgi:hypothetical protein
MSLKNILEIVVVVSSVIGLVWAGIQIGREFGTLEKFVIALLEKATFTLGHSPQSTSQKKNNGAETNLNYLYLLWGHDEDGPEGLVATVDRGAVMELAATQDTNGWFARAGGDVLNKLAGLLYRDDADLAADTGIHPLMPGWGGLHFQVVRLFERHQG